MGPFEIVLGLVYGVLGWSAGEAWKHGVKFARERRPLKKLYPFERSKVWIVLSEFKINKVGEFFDKVSPIDGVYSFDDLSDYLRKIGLSRLDYATYFASDMSDEEREENLILIGGYENNIVSRTMNEEHYKKRHFHLKNNKIIERGGDDRVWEIGPKQLDESGRIIKDFCLITKMPNPFCRDERKSWVVAFEGVREYGTWGAVRYWNEQIFSHFKQLKIRVKRSDTLEVVVAINVNQSNKAPSRRVEFGGIEAAYVNGVIKK